MDTAAVRTDHMSSEPVRAPQRQRLLGLDVARALALFGIMANHLLSGPTWAAHTLVHLMSDYHAVGFAVLIGAGAQLEGQRKSGREQAISVTMRAGFLCLLGFTLGMWVTSVAVILVTLGFLTALAYIGAKLPAKTLAVALVLVGLLGPVGTIANRLYEYLPANLNPNFYDLAHPRQIAALFISDPYPFLAWLFYALCGIALMRWAGARARPVVVGISLVAGGFAVVLLTSCIPVPDQYVPYIAALEYSGSYGNIAASAAIVCGLILCCYGLDLRMGDMARWAQSTWRVLAQVGQLTLTWYVVHVVVSNPIIPYLEHLERAERYVDFAVWVGQIVVIVAVTVLYRRAFRLGPLEAVPRELTRVCMGSLSHRKRRLAGR